MALIHAAWTAGVAGSAIAALFAITIRSREADGASDARKVVVPAYPAVMAAESDGESVAVPETAVLRVDGKPTVWVAETSLHLFVATPVTLGPRRGAMRQVLFGLLPGQLVVTAGMASLPSETREGSFIAAR